MSSSPGNNPRWPLWVLGALFVCLLLYACRETEPPPPPGLPSSPGVHVLLALDDGDGSIGRSVAVDGGQMTALVEAGVPQARRTLTVLKGRHLTRKNVLRYYEQVNLGPSDVILFYFSGHGATNPREGHYLHMPSGGRLLRSDLRAAVQGKKARLAVILTDCCAETAEAGAVGAAPTPDLKPVLDRLLFRHTGLVDINACSVGEYAYCNDRSGGYFTASFFGECQRLAAAGKTAGWEELFVEVVRRTQELAREGGVKQTPQAMSPLAGAREGRRTP